MRVSLEPAMQTPRASAVLLAIITILCSCGSTTKGETVELSGSTPCEKYASLAQTMHCRPPMGCTTPANCNDVANRWIECAARDLAQCMCESDGDLNCEGSYKPNEGPAKCIAEASALGTCTGT
jgi:hypothetical protein